MKSMSWVRKARALSLLGPLWLMIGCGQSDPERLAVRGAVWLDGEPLPAGRIEFLPRGDTRSPATTGVVRDGCYELPRGQGPVVGEYRVAIHVQAAVTFDLSDDLAYAAARATSRTPLDLGFRTTRFKDPAASTIRLEDETSALDFELETVSRTRNR